MLFYYFKSKEELYHYLIDYSLDVVTNQYLRFVDESEQDFIERYRHAAQIKIKAYTENPYVFNFLGSIFLSDELDLPEKLDKRFQDMRDLALRKMYSNIDMTLFRKDVDQNRIMKLIHWSMDGYENEISQQLKGQNLDDVDFDAYFDDFFAYLDTMKLCFYEQETK
jgi:TetR/AcrR family transcriptional regulator